MVWLSVAVVVAGVVALAVVVWRGCLRRDALADGPARAVGLQWWDLPAGVAVMMAGGVVAGLVGGLVAVVWPGLAMDMEAGGPGEPGGPGVRVQAVWLLVVQVVSQGAVLGYLAWRVMMEPGRPGGLRRLGVWPRGVWVEWRDGLVGLAAAMPLVLGTLVLMGWVGELIGQPAPSVGHELLLTMASTDDAVGLALLVVAVVVVAPFFEEVIFRGLVQTTLLSVLGPGRRWVIVGVSAAGFAMIHAGAATFGGEGAGGVPWHALPGLAVLGVVLGWLYEKTGSLWPAVIVHAGFNGYNVAAVLTGVAGG